MSKFIRHYQGETKKPGNANININIIILISMIIIVILIPIIIFIAVVVAVAVVESALLIKWFAVRFAPEQLQLSLMSPPKTKMSINLAASARHPCPECPDSQKPESRVVSHQNVC